MTSELNHSDLVEALKRVVIEECDKDVDPADMPVDEPLMGGSLDLDSLDALQVSLALQKQYGVRIEGGPDGRKAFASLNALADFIIAAKAAPPA
ncbi:MULTISPECIES: phosphopantetheine-binding protein [unclassified Brevundimonas]|uniref:phosphopantetheine-binding protein n=1 Tax=unclassified Brevundimonas TaxID=2622653 RepID=UPI003B5861B1